MEIRETLGSKMSSQEMSLKSRPWVRSPKEWVQREKEPPGSGIGNTEECGVPEPEKEALGEEGLICMAHGAKDQIRQDWEVTAVESKIRSFVTLIRKMTEWHFTGWFEGENEDRVEKASERNFFKEFLYTWGSDWVGTSPEEAVHTEVSGTGAGDRQSLNQIFHGLMDCLTQLN